MGIAVRNIECVESGLADAETVVHVLQVNSKRRNDVVSAADRDVPARIQPAADISDQRSNAPADVNIPCVLFRTLCTGQRCEG